MKENVNNVIPFTKKIRKVKMNIHQKIEMIKDKVEDPSTPVKDKLKLIQWIEKFRIVPRSSKEADALRKEMDELVRGIIDVRR